MIGLYLHNLPVDGFGFANTPRLMELHGVCHGLRYRVAVALFQAVLMAAVRVRVFFVTPCAQQCLYFLPLPQGQG